jgi:hypothetical protein
MEPESTPEATTRRHPGRRRASTQITSQLGDPGLQLEVEGDQGSDATIALLVVLHTDMRSGVHRASLESRLVV